MKDDFRTGHIAIVGRPNVGKSTLTNGLVGAKVSITSRKAQTTRHRIRGVLTTADAQYIFVDTPGFQTKHRNALNRLMNRNVSAALREVDVIVLVVEAGRWGSGEDAIVGMLPPEMPAVLAINKIDRLSDKGQLLPFIERVAKLHPFVALVPVSAARGQGGDELLKVLRDRLPVAPAEFDADDFTDRPERFLAAELLREKLFRNLGEELPYGVAVEIEQYQFEDGPGGGLRRITAAVLVDKAAHKVIVIGRSGERLKRVASDARHDMEQLFGGRVWLETWVKVRSGWADDERVLKSLGYE